MPEITKLRRRARISMLLSGFLAALAAYGFLRPTGSGGATDQAGQEEVEELKDQISRAGYAQRLRLIHQLGRTGGTQAEEAILELLDNADNDRMRLAAIGQLSRVGGPKAVEVLAELARTAKRSVQRKAIAALGQIGSPEAVTRLIELVEDDGDRPARQMAVAALGRAGGAEAVKVLSALALDPRAEVRLDSIEALGATGSEDALEVLSKLLEDPAIGVRRQAVAALGTTGAEEAKNLLIRMAQEQGSDQLRPDVVSALSSFSGDAVQMVLISLSKSKDRAVALAALRGLGGSESPMAQEVLLAALRDGTRETAEVAIGALGEQESSEVTQALLQRLQQDRNVYSAATALAGMKGDEARQGLLQAARDGTVETQMAVVSAFSSLKGPEVDAALAELVGSASPQVAARALRELASRDKEAALPLLIKSYREGSHDLRFVAFNEIAESEGPASKEIVMEAIRSGNPAMVNMGINALGQRRSPETTATLIELVEKGDDYTRNSALNALGNLGGEEARRTLLKAFKEGDNAATWALTRNEDPRTVEELGKLLDDSSASVEIKQRAMQVLRSVGSTGDLQRMALHPDPKLSGEALNALGAVGGPQAEATLLSAAGSSEGERKVAAFSALAELRTPKALQAMAQALHDPETMPVAVRSLARDGSARSIGNLVDFYRSADDKNRAMILQNVSQFPTRQSRQLLEQALTDNNGRVAATAARALARVGTGALQGRLLAMLQSSPHKEVRHGIASVLRWSNERLYKQHKELIDQIYDEGL